MTEINATTPGFTQPAAIEPRPAYGALPSGKRETFGQLMNLQGRGRALEAKLAASATGADRSDPAKLALAQESKGQAAQLHELRGMVGAAPGSNARRMLASMLARLEGGGSLNSGDRARLKLAIAADEHRVDLAGARKVAATIASLEAAGDSVASQAKDPSLIQDPARLAIFKQQMSYVTGAVEKLEQMLVSGRVDPKLVMKLASASGQQNHGHVVRDVTSALGNTDAFSESGDDL
ncbi:MAG: hypothetical protein JWM86_2189 [Thermoleophilia bacterium]|nr:hypothetical protein [Thermoleophilia bacterium]